MASSDTLVVAIDFGTTYSGYAYSFKSDKTNVKTVTKWSGKLDSPKIPTSILLDPAREFHSFGYDAEDHYAGLCDDDKAKNWALFRRFKMCLYNNKTLLNSTEIEDVTESIKMPAMTIFTMAIKYLKDHAIKTVKNLSNRESEGRNLTEMDIHFVLTVPAIWDDRARLFMRKAAENAGIPKVKLRLSLESEAASVWCQSIPLAVSKGEMSSLSSVGSTYMVVDIGGGTADITVHKKLTNGKLSELHKADGGDLGGTRVDKAFIDMLEDIMGRKAMARFKIECIGDFLDLLKEFEMVKRATDPKSDTRLKIRLPETLRDITRDEKKSAFRRSLSKTLRTLKGEGISIDNDKLRIGAQSTIKLFANSVDGICEKIKEILRDQNMGEVEHILVAGGFSESSVVSEALKRNFSRATFIFPTEPSLVVMKGAVLYGHDPDIIESRKACFTYGLKYTADFDGKKHDKKYRSYVNGKTVCTNLFHILVKQGADVRNGERVEVQHKPQPDEHNNITFEMYLCTRQQPMYVDEPQCKVLGKVETKLLPDDRHIETTLLIKDTDMFMEILHTKTGKTESERFDFT